MTSMYLQIAIAVLIGVPALVLGARSAVLFYAKRNPYFDLADYMSRFWVKRHNKDKSNIAARAHNIKRSDYDRALHDHPWPNASLVLFEGYWEIVPGILQSAFEADLLADDAMLCFIKQTIENVGGKELDRATRKHFAAYGVLWRGPGAFVRREAEQLHRLVIPKGRQAWSLFFMGAKCRDWGFMTPEGWVHNEVYTAALGRDA